MKSQPNRSKLFAILGGERRLQTSVNWPQWPRNRQVSSDFLGKQQGTTGCCRDTVLRASFGVTPPSANG
eukprot:2589144-Amphidinium_carterae.1